METKTPPKFTIITPVYNGEDYLEETIVSVLNTVEGLEFEYLIVNDGSTDKTSEILARYLDRITVLNQENAGQANAINLGLGKARGKYTTIVNSDDPLIASKLFESAASILDQNLELVGVYPDWSIISNEGKVIRKVQTKEYSKLELLGRFNCLIGPGGVFRTNAAIEVGGWDSKYKFVPDYDFWLKLSTVGDFKRIPENLALWRMHNSSISESGKTSQMAVERIDVVSNHLRKYPQESYLENLALSNAFYRAAILCFFDPSIKGNKYLLKSFSYNKINILSKNKFVLLFLILSPITTKLCRIRFINKLLMKFAKQIELN